MTEYKCHWWSAEAEPALTPVVTLAAETRIQGAALALPRLMELGCDIGAPHAHVDMTDPNGETHMVLVEEVLDWLDDPRQEQFVRREGLEALRRTDGTQAPG